MPRPFVHPVDKFWEYANPISEAECWLWTGPKHGKGYGHVYMGRGFIEKAHRLSYMLFKGDPGELHVCHHCDTPACVNPSHLFLGTNEQNHADKIEKGRQRFGTRHPKAKLTYGLADAIRADRASGAGQVSLAERYGVSRATIRCVLDGKTWIR